MGLLSRLTGSKKTAATQRVSKTSAATAARIKNILGVRQLSSMPAQAARAFQLASDPNAKNDDFVSVIESDEVLGAKIIRVANSVYFSRGTEATDIRTAVTTIGLSELRCLLSASMLKNLLKGRHPARKNIWANSIATGICARTLAEDIPHLAEGEAFLCGLLHDVGKLVMIQQNGELYSKVIDETGRNGKDFLAAEESELELNHVEVGKWVAELWKFPSSVVHTIAFHHEPWPADVTKNIRNLSYAGLVRAADIISHSLGIGHAAHFVSLRNKAVDHLPSVFEILQLEQNQGQEFIKDFERQFKREQSMFEIEE